MKKMKGHIRLVMLWEFKNNKNATKAFRDFVVLLTAKSETCSLGFVLPICLWEMYPDQDPDQAPIEML